MKPFSWIVVLCLVLAGGWAALYFSQPPEGNANDRPAEMQLAALRGDWVATMTATATHYAASNSTFGIKKRALELHLNLTTGYGATAYQPTLPFTVCQQAADQHYRIGAPTRYPVNGVMWRRVLDHEGELGWCPDGVPES